jgi:hypothetical protein
MSTEIQPTEQQQKLQKELEEKYGGLIKNELSFIPLIRIAQKSSSIVDDADANVKVGDLYFGQDRGLGTSTLAIVLADQWHAIKIEKGKKVLESYNCIHEMVEQECQGEMVPVKTIVGDETFVAIVNGQDDQKEQIAHRWGPELLLYLPEINQFAVYFLNTNTQRKHWLEFLNPRTYGRPVELSTKKIAPANSTYVWWEPQVRTVQRAELPENFALPAPERIQAAIKKFTSVANEVEEGETPPER